MEAGARQAGRAQGAAQTGERHEQGHTAAAGVKNTERTSFKQAF